MFRPLDLTMQKSMSHHIHTLMLRVSFMKTPTVMLPQNGVVERKNRHLMLQEPSCFKCMLLRDFGVKCLQALILLVACKLMFWNSNTFASSYTSSIQPARVFGCVFCSWSWTADSKIKCLGYERSFLRYSPIQKGYKYFVSSLYKWYVTKDVTFFEERS